MGVDLHFFPGPGLWPLRCFSFFLLVPLLRYAYMIRRDAVRFQVPTVSGGCLDRKEPGEVRRPPLQLVLVQILRRIDATWEKLDIKWHIF